MRRFLLAVVAAAAGCAAQGLPIESAGGGLGSSGGGAPGPDMSRRLGGAGDSCQTACDCMPGLACPSGNCVKSTLGVIYCCDDSSCPTGNFCQSASGGFGQCGGGNGGGGGFNPGGPPFFDDMMSLPPDAGISCRQLNCMRDSDCVAAGCSTCSLRGFCRP
jgi:hypothetical protein